MGFPRLSVPLPNYGAEQDLFRQFQVVIREHFHVLARDLGVTSNTFRFGSRRPTTLPAEAEPGLAIPPVDDGSNGIDTQTG